MNISHFSVCEMFDIQEHVILAMISFETYMVSRNPRPVHPAHPFKDTASFVDCWFAAK